MTFSVKYILFKKRKMRKIACCNFNLIAKITYTYGIYYVLDKKMMISSLVKNSKLEGKKKNVEQYHINTNFTSKLTIQFTSKLSTGVHKLTNYLLLYELFT